MRFKPIRLAAFTAALFTACLSFSFPAQAQNDNLIVASVRIGEARIGMTEADIYRILGEPKSSFIGAETTLYTYPNFDVYVDKRSHRVYRLITASSLYATKDNIKVGSSMLEVTAKLGTHAGCNFSRCTYGYKGLSVGTSTSAIGEVIWVINN